MALTDTRFPGLGDEVKDNETTYPNESQARIPNRVVIAASVFSILLGVLVLIGWLLDIAVLKSLYPGLVAMKANTALCLVLAGASLWLWQVARDKGAQACAVVVALIGLLTLCERIFSRNLGLDQLLFHEAPDPVLAIYPGRMSTPAALAFLQLGLALLLLGTRAGRGAAQWLGLGAGSAAVLAIVWYLFGIFSYEVGMNTFIALHTALTLAVLGAGVVLSCPDRELAMAVGRNLSSVGFCFSMAILIAVGGSMYLNTSRSIETNHWVEHTFQVIETLTQVLANMSDAESAQRGFVITGGEPLLAHYGATLADVERADLEVQKLTRDNVNQQHRLKILKPLIAEKVAMMNNLIGIRRREGPEPAIRLISSGESIQAMKDIRKVIHDMIHEEEEELLRRRTIQAAIATTNAVIALSVGAVVGFCVLIAVFYSLHREIGERKRADAALQSSEQRLNMALDSAQMGAWELDLVNDTSVRSLRHDLIFGYTTMQPKWGAEIFMSHVPPSDRNDVQKCFDRAFETGEFNMECRIVRADEAVRWISAQGRCYRNSANKFVRMMGIVMDITERKQAEDLKHKLNTDLQCRTEQLGAANKELEAFSYSVSHDLRAPLRHINGYLNLLQKHTASTLDEKSLRYMRTIAESATQMSALIDDLLSFSHMGRSEMRMGPVNLDALVQEVLKGVQIEVQGRQVAWTIGTLPEVYGDRAMLRQVMVNLLVNAVKYTQRRDRAEIEIGTESTANEHVIFVKDNGVGFDMQYVDKLFGVFQRLHTSEEFEGTGIGLANVRRVIARHGGRTWAEGKVDCGAKISFSLPKIREGTA